MVVLLAARLEANSILNAQEKVTFVKCQSVT